MKILTQVTLDSYRRRKDRSCSFTFITDLEVSSDEIRTFDELLDTRGILYYKSKGNLTQEEVDELDNVDIELGGKTKSKRLRNVLFILWSQEGKKGDFKDFYSHKMEEIIEHFKGKLNED